MTVKTGSAWAGLFVCLDATGALAAGTPAGVLYVDGTANGATVTITGSNPYKWSVTLPALTAGQRVDMYITATISSIATAAVVASEQADTALTSEVKTETAAILADTGTDGVKLAADQAVDVTKIGGQAINGYNATLKLKALDIQNSSGTAVNFVSTGGNGSGLRAVGNGTGHGFIAKGGDTANGAFIQGGSISGNGLSLSSIQVGGGAGLAISGENLGLWVNGTNGDISADEIAAIKSDTAAILADTGTDGVVLANNAITAAKIAVDAIGADEISAGAVTKVATGVWASATRTLSSFGTLVSDIWGAATRTLSAFGFTVATNSDANVTAIKAKTDNLPASPAAVGSAMTLSNNAITAAVIATDAIDADSIKADAITEIQAGLLNALLASYTVSGSVGESLGRLDNIQAKTDLITTGTTLTVASAVSGSTITAHRGDTLSAALENIGALTNNSKLWFTVKRDFDDADSAAIVQIEKTGGLLFINGAAGTTGNGSLTINDEASGDVTIVLNASETAKLSPGNYQYDIQILRSAGTPVSTLTYGEFVVAADVTKATA